MINETKLREAIINSANQWRTKNKELLSCFDAERLFEIIHAYNDLEPDSGFEAMLKTLTFGEPTRRNIMAQVVSEAGPSEEETISKGLELSFDKAFLTLWDRGALASLLAVDDIPARAQQDLDRIARNVAASTPAPKVAVAAPPPVEDPVKACVRAFHELGSKEFQALYVNNAHGRKHFDEAVSRGWL
jgi:hypothetical protein